jgi:hypothetical protein
MPTGGYDGGGAYYFDNTTSRMSSTTNPLSSIVGTGLDGDFTISLWAKADSYGGWLYEFGENLQGTGSDDWLALILANDGFMRFQFQDGASGQATIDTPFNITLDEWHHYLVTFTRTGTSDSMEFFVDGNSIGTGPESGSLNINWNTGGMTVGDWDYPTIDGFFHGTLDAFQVYDRVLNASEITELSTPCTPNWVCDGYEACVEPALNASCNSVYDSNACGQSYTGDYSEFSVDLCVYEVNETSSSSGSGTRYLVDADGNIVGVQQNNQVQLLEEPSKGTFLSLTGGEGFDIKAWYNDLVATIKGWFVQ